jgi:hypothetical protein
MPGKARGRRFLGAAKFGGSTKARRPKRYPGQGSPWSDFLHHRARAIDEMMTEGLRYEAIAQKLSMDPIQVELIHRRRREGD